MTATGVDESVTGTREDGAVPPWILGESADDWVTEIVSTSQQQVLPAKVLPVTGADVCAIAQQQLRRTTEWEWQWKTE